MKVLSGAQALQSKLELLQKRSRKLLTNHAIVLGFTFWSHFRTFLKFPKITHFLTKKCCLEPKDRISMSGILLRTEFYRRLSYSKTIKEVLLETLKSIRDFCSHRCILNKRVCKCLKQIKAKEYFLIYLCLRIKINMTCY